MAVLLLPNVSRLWFGDGTEAPEVLSLWYGAELVYGPGLDPPPALTVGDWTLEAEPVGPFAAHAYITVNLADPSGVQWTAAATPEEGDWLQTEPVGGRWRLLNAPGDRSFAEGSYTGIKARWRSGSNNRFSLVSTDAKSFSFTDYAIEPVSATIEVDLLPGQETVFDCATAFDQVPATPEWEKFYWIADGAFLLPPYRFEGSNLIVTTPLDRPAGTVTVTVDAAFALLAPDLPAPVALGAGTWEVTQGDGAQTFDASALFSGLGVGYTIFQITGATSYATFGVSDGFGGYQQFTTPTGPLEIVADALDITLDGLTGVLTAQGNDLPTMEGVVITIRATNSGGFADENVNFSVVAPLSFDFLPFYEDSEGTPETTALPFYEEAI